VLATWVAGFSTSGIQCVLENKTLAAALDLLGKQLVFFGALQLEV